MLQLSRLFPIFVTSFEKNRQKHREERISFDPSENLENSKYKGEKSESCFSCSSIYTAYSAMESVYIYTCRCELIFILTYTGIAALGDEGDAFEVKRRKNHLAKDVEEAHTYCTRV